MDLSDAAGSSATLPPLGNERLERLRTVILEHGYLRREQPFQLSSGGMSYDYVDLRRALSRGPDLAAAAEALLEVLEVHAPQYDAIGGMTMGADPIAHAVAMLAGRSWFSVRKQEKHHGAGRRIEGAPLGPGRRVVLVEDTVSTGRSILEALEVVVASGASVLVACTLLDRGELATARFSDLGVPYFSLLSYGALGIEPIGDVANTAP